VTMERFRQVSPLRWCWRLYRRHHMYPYLKEVICKKCSPCGGRSFIARRSSSGVLQSNAGAIAVFVHASISR
jgi:hypothetical protein